MTSLDLRLLRVTSLDLGLLSGIVVTGLDLGLLSGIVVTGLDLGLQ